MKKLLVLGAGLVARPLVRYLLDQEDFHVSVAEQLIDRAKSVVGDHPNGTALSLQADDKPKLAALIAQHDLTISLLPAPLHPSVAELCIQAGKHMVTASYVSPQMAALDQKAKDAGVMILNEIGVDPGIDHMSAMRVIHDVIERGGSVVEFRSNCGGLPAPEYNDNPWGYKFSWSPRGVCTAGKNSAKFRLDGKQIDVPGPELFTHNTHGMNVEGVGQLEAYPNRDSLSYIDTYGLDNIRTMFRGTFRYPGWCETLKKIVDLGLLDETPTTYPADTTFAGFTATFLPSPPTTDLRGSLAAHLNLDPASPVLDRLEWLGLLSDETIPLAGQETTPLDVLAARMEAKMLYRPGERDMLVLVHDFIAEFPSAPSEHITSTLVAYGIPDGDSAMSRTVGLPAAIGAKLIATGQVLRPGVCIPVTPDLYNPVLDELGALGIHCQESSERIK